MSYEMSGLYKKQMCEAYEISSCPESSGACVPQNLEDQIQRFLDLEIAYSKAGEIPQVKDPLVEKRIKQISLANPLVSAVIEQRIGQIERSKKWDEGTLEELQRQCEAKDLEMEELKRCLGLPIHERQIWNIANTIETIQKEQFQGIRLECKNRNLSETFSFVFGPKESLVYVMLKSPQGFVARSSFKKVKLVVVVPFQTESAPWLIIQKENRKYKKRCDSWEIAALKANPDLPERCYDDLRREIKLNSLYRCAVPPLFAISRDPTDTEPGQSHVFEPFLNIFEPWFHDLHVFSDEDWVDCISGLVDGLLELHKSGRVHGDIKWPNALWRRTEEGKVECRWIDLSHSDLIENFAPDKWPLKNYYGSLMCTPPELLLNSLSAPEELCAVECWALGFFSCSMLFGIPPWWRELRAIYDRGLPPTYMPMTEAEAVKIKILMQESLAEIRQHVEESPHSTLRSVQLICLNLMAFDPKQRLSLELAKLQLERLRTTVCT
jgi:hypothetical protein